MAQRGNWRPETRSASATPHIIQAASPGPGVLSLLDLGAGLFAAGRGDGEGHKEGGGEGVGDAADVEALVGPSHELLDRGPDDGPEHGHGHGREAPHLDHHPKAAA